MMRVAIYARVPSLTKTSPLLHAAHINPLGQYRFDLARMRRA